MTWTNPKFADSSPTSTPAPPEPSGHLLGSFLRRGQAGAVAELRATLESYEGHEYLALRLWEADRAGQFWPTRKGVTVRLSEGQGVVDALNRGLDLATPRPEPRPLPSHHRTRGRDDRRPDRRLDSAPTLPGIAGPRRGPLDPSLPEPSVRHLDEFRGQES